jgi:arabinosaccharide transport system substrate-binding protein
MEEKMFRGFAALSLIVVMLVALVPAAPMVQADGPTKITFWTFVDAHAQFWQTQAERWNAANPDRQIELEPTVYPWSDMHDRLLLALQSGVEAPDMVDIEISRFSPFVRGDIHLQPLNDIIDPVSDQLVESRLIYQKDGTGRSTPSTTMSAPT